MTYLAAGLYLVGAGFMASTIAAPPDVLPRTRGALLITLWPLAALALTIALLRGSNR